MTTCHLIPNGKLPFRGDVHLNLLDNPWVDVITALELVHRVFVLLIELLEAGLKLGNNLTDFVANRRGINIHVIVHKRELAQQRLGNLAVSGDDDFTRLRIHDVERNLFPQKDVGKRLGKFLVKLQFFLLEMLLSFLLLALGFAWRKLDLRNFLTTGNLNVHHDAVGTRRDRERSVFHIGRLLTEDCAQKTLFRSKFRFALWRDLTHKNVPWANLCSNTNYAVRAEIAQRFFRNVRNIASDFLRPKFGIASAALEFVDVNGSVDVFLNHAFRDRDGVFEVVTVPRHERHEHVTTKGEFATVAVRTISNDLPFGNLLTLFNNRPLIHTSTCVGTHELTQIKQLNAVSRIVFESLFAFRHFAVS